MNLSELINPKSSSLQPAFISQIRRFQRLGLFILAFCFSSTLFGQIYTATESGDWNSITWECENNGSATCSNNPPPPGNNIESGKVIIIPLGITVNYSESNAVIIRDGGRIEINGGKLILQQSLIINIGGELEVSNGSIDIGLSQLRNEGSITLSDSDMRTQGKIYNRTTGSIATSNSCIRVLDNDFKNTGIVSGSGAIRVYSGNITGSGPWASGVLFSSSGYAYVSGTESSIQEFEKYCDCRTANCDIIPAWVGEPKVDDLIGNALINLAGTYLPYCTQGAIRPNVNPFIYVLKSGGNIPKVLIEIHTTNYLSVQNYLSDKAIPDDYVEDYYDDLLDVRMITLYFPICELLDLNQQGSIIQFVEKIGARFTNSGSILSQGDAAQGSDLGKLGWGVSGAGIKIGVISDSYDQAIGTGNATTDIGNGDLPSNTQVLKDYPGVASDEGRAMLQIVHDVAPGAELFFRTGFLGEGSMAAAIRELEAQGCDIIVDDVQYVSEPIYKDGLIARAVQEVVSNGVEYFSAAGNFGSRSFEDTFSGGSNNRHDFDNDDLQTMNLGVGQYLFVLQWDNDFYSLGTPGASTDLDIYLVNDDGSILYGFNRDNLGENPVEAMPFTVVNPTVSHIVIEDATGNANGVKFKYVVFRAGDNPSSFSASPPIEGSTIVGHASTDASITVGAVRYDRTPAYNGVLSPMSFSSWGSTDNAKPDFMAPNGVNTSVALGDQSVLNFDGGAPNFFGTSAAAPHAAAAAALLIEAQAKFNVSFDIRDQLKSTAYPMANPIISGDGFINVYTALGDFANPAPVISSWTVPNNTDPGSDYFILTIEGEYFVSSDEDGDGDPDTEIWFNGVQIQYDDGPDPDNLPDIQFVGTDIILVSIPPYVGSPPLYIITNSKTDEGTDGGQTDPPIRIEDLPTRNVYIEGPNLTKKYGESIPDISDIENLITTHVGSMSGPPLTQAELSSLLSSGAIELSYPTNTQGNILVNSESDVGTYAIEVIINNSNIEPGLSDVYDFIPEFGGLEVEPLTVTIKPKPLTSIYYGDEVPTIAFDYLPEVDITNGVKSSIETGHTNAMALVNRAIAYVNGAVAFVNSNGDLSLQLSNGNSIPLVNSEGSLKSFYISENALSNGAVAFVNGVSIGDVAFDDLEGLGPFTNRSLALVNAWPLVNRGIPLVNGMALVNRVALVNGVPLVNGNALPLVNGTAFVNGSSIPLVNSSSNPLGSSLINSTVILNSADQNTTPQILPINLITGLEAGTQYIVPGGFFNDNLVLKYEATAIEILPRPITVTPNNANITYGEEIITEGANSTFSSSITSTLDHVLGFGETEEDVFPPDGITYSAACTQCDAGQHVVSISNTATSNNYDISIQTGTLTVEKFDLEVTPSSRILFGQTVNANNTTLTFNPPVSEFPFGEDENDVFPGGTANLNYSTNCNPCQVNGTNNRVFVTGNYSDNYDVTFLPGPLSINSTGIVVTPNDVTTVYGETPQFTSDFDNDPLFNSVFPNGISYTSCQQCNTTTPGSEHVISIDISNVSPNFNVIPGTGKLTVNPFEITVTADDAAMNYGQTSHSGFAVTFNPPEALFPYQETADQIFGQLQFAPIDECAPGNSISVNPKPSTPNYNVTYREGTLHFNSVDLDVIIQDSYVEIGSNIPGSFDYEVTGLVCGDSAPSSSDIEFELLDQNGAPATEPLQSGVYDVFAVLSDPSGNYANYSISATPGKFYVTPTVSCANKIQVSNVCKVSNVSLPGIPQANTLVRFEYNNLLDVPIYITHGPNNYVSGSAFFVNEDNRPEVFLPGKHTFEMYTNGGSVRWWIRTPGCYWFSSINAINATSCTNFAGPTSSLSSSTAVTPADSILANNIATLTEPDLPEEKEARVFPNPASDMVWLETTNYVGPTTIQIYNSVGALLSESRHELKISDRIRLDVERFSSGLLFIRIESGEDIKILRISKH